MVSALSGITTFFPVFESIASFALLRKACASPSVSLFPESKVSKRAFPICLNNSFGSSLSFAALSEFNASIATFPISVYIWSTSLYSVPLCIIDEIIWDISVTSARSISWSAFIWIPP